MCYIARGVIEKTVIFTNNKDNSLPIKLSPKSIRRSKWMQSDIQTKLDY